MMDNLPPKLPNDPDEAKGHLRYTDELHIKRRRAEESKPRPNGNGSSSYRFPVTWIDDINVDAEPVWLIKDLLPASGIGVVFGLPKSGKSFILADALFHVAMDRVWSGRDVLPGSVLYLSSEGKRGLRRRLVAMRRHYGVEGQRVPFGFIPVMPDLGHRSGDAEALVASIRGALIEHDSPPLRVVAIDTLARAMSGADENAAKDMGVLVANAEAIAEELGCLVVLVHHAGRAADARSRGSNALDGAADVMWHVEKNEEGNRVSIHEMKDGEAGLEWTFRLKPHWLDLADASTCTVEIMTTPRQPLQADPKPKLKANVALGLRGLVACLVDHGKPPPYREQIPQSVTKVVTPEQWRDYLIKQNVINGAGNYRQEFIRIRDALKLAGQIGVWEEHVWAVT